MQGLADDLVIFQRLYDSIAEKTGGYGLHRGYQKLSNGSYNYDKKVFLLQLMEEDFVKLVNEFDLEYFDLVSERHRNTERVVDFKGCQFFTLYRWDED